MFPPEESKANKVGNITIALHHTGSTCVCLPDISAARAPHLSEHRQKRQDSKESKKFQAELRSRLAVCSDAQNPDHGLWHRA